MGDKDLNTGHGASKRVSMATRLAKSANRRQSRMRGQLFPTRPTSLTEILLLCPAPEWPSLVCIFKNDFSRYHL